ncbi:hypothetical protein KEK_16663 [Mycolicibacterium thermoresistibile ATCC 19527]|uniref:Uncharacterized protein n=1 Tax=Mycolicibacterium thermoresistibile (strain ATCC 19527 / DSM 44167 / CIP 105390 / JCM 6362 / NCTC 10409 / 316) TaxID=1078020 RepID=G7CIE3_MYCT3|nr:hypothetical protein KEK_16663 [Mycolicibacterium thermoresistibile ATCC 19527]
MGWIAVIFLAAVLLFAVLLGIRSIPDARRYLKIRRM